MSNIETARRELANHPELLAEVEAMAARGVLEGELSDLDLEMIAAGKDAASGGGRRSGGGRARTGGTRRRR